MAAMRTRRKQDAGKRRELILAACRNTVVRFSHHRQVEIALPRRGGAKLCCWRVRPTAIEGVTKPDVRRLARRGGVRRTSSIVYEETRGALKIFLEQLTYDALLYSDARRRDESESDFWQPHPTPTLTAEDVVRALRRSGMKLVASTFVVRYGCNSFCLSHDFCYSTTRNPRKHDRLGHCIILGSSTCVQFITFYTCNLAEDLSSRFLPPHSASIESAKTPCLSLVPIPPSIIHPTIEGHSFSDGISPVSSSLASASGPILPTPRIPHHIRYLSLPSFEVGSHIARHPFIRLKAVEPRRVSVSQLRKHRLQLQSGIGISLRHMLCSRSFHCERYSCVSTS
ncbi:Histone H4 [Mycena venus]|uniref:Histone H4 n=1 Tax=Mycena venus TaxID=2733690 RepID=A0A8H6YKU5_9AGAR|nr:Histone H4 [Mycena venus]